MVFWSCMELQDETTIHMLEHELQEAEAHHDDYERQVKALEGKLAEHQVAISALQRQRDGLEKAREYVLAQAAKGLPSPITPASTPAPTPTKDKKAAKGVPVSPRTPASPPPSAATAAVARENADLTAKNEALAATLAGLLAQLKRTDSAVVALQSQVAASHAARPGPPAPPAEDPQVAMYRQRIYDLEAHVTLTRAETAALRQQVDAASKTKEGREARRREREAKVAEVNAQLAALAADAAFQDHLQTPKVKAALDLWGGSHTREVLTPAQMDEIRRDPGVMQVFPRLKALEAICDKAGIFFPITFVRAGKPALDDDALLRIYGPDDQ